MVEAGEGRAAQILKFLRSMTIARPWRSVGRRMRLYRGGLLNRLQRLRPFEIKQSTSRRRRLLQVNHKFSQDLNLQTVTLVPMESRSTRPQANQETRSLGHEDSDPGCVDGEQEQQLDCTLFRKHPRTQPGSRLRPLKSYLSGARICSHQAEADPIPSTLVSTSEEEGGQQLVVDLNERSSTLQLPQVQFRIRGLFESSATRSFDSEALCRSDKIAGLSNAENITCHLKGQWFGSQLQELKTDYSAGEVATLVATCDLEHVEAGCRQLLFVEAKLIAEEYLNTLMKDCERLRGQSGHSGLEHCREDLEGRLKAVMKERDDLQSRVVNLEEEINQKVKSLECLNSTIVELTKVAQDHEACQFKASHFEKLALERQLLNSNCGSYVDELATPFHLNKAMCTTKTAISRFQKEFAESLKSNQDRYPTYVIDLLLSSDDFFARQQHKTYAVKAFMYDVFFEGFENESFNTSNGASVLLDPDIRSADFNAYYQRNHEQKFDSADNVDPQFKEFCTMKVAALWRKSKLELEEMTNLASLEDSEMIGAHQVSSLDIDGTGKTINLTVFLKNLKNLGGPQLVSSFKAAARSVWLLHKLAFSFEPPAAIFRVAKGDNFDANYMESIVSLEDDKRFVPKVGLMIAPGLRLRKTVLRSEIYLAGDIDNTDGHENGWQTGYLLRAD